VTANTNAVAAGSGLPLEGLLVVDLSQFLAGPYASLRLQDLGARVIKVEWPGQGDLCRRLYVSDTVIDDESTVFHAINRGKESIALDLHSENDRLILDELIKRADVFLQNFRPGVIERLGFAPDRVFSLNPRVIYGSVTGYGEGGDWSRYPGQDLLAQARSGVMWLNGNAGDGPVPIGLPIADIMAGANLTQGVLAALVRRGITSAGGLVETSLLESMIDVQFEVLTAHLNGNGDLPARSSIGSAHAGLAAPYGIYPARDGFIAIAMSSLPKLAELLEIPELAPYIRVPRDAFDQRDTIKQLIADQLATNDVSHWRDILEPNDIWCAPVMNWSELFDSDSFRQLDQVQEVAVDRERSMKLLRSPLRVDHIRARAAGPAPALDAHRTAIIRELDLEERSH
jgi:crotonobetainyl-CoA:carnitine CoA-transferase CaiB-like acyl-CoA transferase